MTRLSLKLDRFLLFLFFLLLRSLSVLIPLYLSYLSDLFVLVYFFLTEKFDLDMRVQQLFSLFNDGSIFLVDLFILVRKDDFVIVKVGFFILDSFLHVFLYLSHTDLVIILLDLALFYPIGTGYL